jgi:aspartyl-tRNA(Asn)/glutamyl-tRNA(Gln) amidotransferase subunit B
MPHEAYEAVIGLEVHVQLLTASKMFCRCPNRFGAAPNTLVCPVCLGYPGTLPVVNRHAVDLAVKLALALGCEVRERSVFARKNYFYPDLPKGYQISQFDRPLAEDGSLPLTLSEKRVRIERLHMEEDAGKLLHEAPGGGALPGESLVDFNRCGVPLVEIVSRPDMTSAAEAQDYLQTLHQVLLYTGTSDGNMEEGSLRCDANVSVRLVGEARLGTKAEVKNLNSFRNVARAIEYEIERQVTLLTGGGRVAQETRSFDANASVTRLLRSKEEAHDYRYFPEPDLPPLVLKPDRIAADVGELPELPWARRARFAQQYGLSAADARLLCADRELADYYEAAVAALPGDFREPRGPKSIANWVMGEVLREV